MRMHLKMFCSKSQTFCVGHNELNYTIPYGDKEMEGIFDVNSIERVEDCLINSLWPSDAIDLGQHWLR